MKFYSKIKQKESLMIEFIQLSRKIFLKISFKYDLFDLEMIGNK